MLTILNIGKGQDVLIKVKGASAIKKNINLRFEPDKYVCII